VINSDPRLFNINFQTNVCTNKIIVNINYKRASIQDGQAFIRVTGGILAVFNGVM